MYVRQLPIGLSRFSLGRGRSSWHALFENTPCLTIAAAMRKSFRERPVGVKKQKGSSAATELYGDCATYDTRTL
jgi:hypothetical protein